MCACMGPRSSLTATRFPDVAQVWWLFGESGITEAQVCSALVTCGSGEVQAGYTPGIPLDLQCSVAT